MPMFGLDMVISIVVVMITIGGLAWGLLEKLKTQTNTIVGEMERRHQQTNMRVVATQKEFNNKLETELNLLEQKIETKYVLEAVYLRERDLFLSELKGVRQDMKDILTAMTNRIDALIMANSNKSN